MRFPGSRPEHQHRGPKTRRGRKNCKMVQSSTSPDKKKKKRKSKRAPTTPPENKEKPQVVSLPPETSPLLPQPSPDQSRGQLPKFRAASKSDGERLAGSSRRSEKHPNASPSLLTVIHKASGNGDPVREYVDRLSTQDRESLRWEGVLEDPQAEEQRLDPYRANRRQRYVAHREALLKVTERDLS